MGRPYTTGSCTKEDPLVYHVTDEFLKDLESGKWVDGMMQAAVKEIRELRKLAANRPLAPYDLEIAAQTSLNAAEEYVGQHWSHDDMNELKLRMLRALEKRFSTSTVRP